MLTVYGNRTSGNSYKLQRLLDQLDRVAAQPGYTSMHQHA